MDHNLNSGNNQNRDNEQWDKWNSNASNSSYYNQPVHRPYGQAFAIASGVCGLLSITTCCSVILPLPLGALGILFGILTYRKGKKMNPTSMAGIVLSSIGLAIAVTMIVYSLVMLPVYMENEVFRNQLYTIMKQMYGQEMADYLMESYGLFMKIF